MAAPSRPWRIRAAAGLLTAAVLAAYAGSFSGGFVLDDMQSIVLNRSLRHLWPPGPALHPPATAGVAGRPVLNLSFALNYAVSGTGVWSYHALNLAIHAAAALALFGLVRRTLMRCGDRLRENALELALASALVWALHPVQTASVTYVSQRAESLMGLAYLLTLYCFIRSADEDEKGRRAAWIALSVGACLLGQATKEVMVTVPLVVLLYDRTFVAGSFREALRQRGCLHLALAGTWVVPLLMMRDLGARGVGFGLGSSGLAYAAVECRAVVRYLGLAVWPHPLIFDYGPQAGQAGSGAACAAVLLLLLGIVLAGCIRRPRIGFPGLVFFLILAPTSSVVPVAFQPIAENRVYLSLAGLSVLAVAGLHALLGRRLWFVVVPLSALLAVLTFRRNADYRSPVSLWRDTVVKSPLNPRAHLNYGNELANTGHPREAIAEFAEALRLKPDTAEAQNNWGNALMSLGGAAEAVDHYRSALRLKPAYPDASSDLAVALLQLGRLPEAEASLRQALTVRPDSVQGAFNLGVVLDEEGRRTEAITAYQRALQVDPDFAPAHFRLGRSFEDAGRFADAAVQFADALRLRPDDAGCHEHLGNVLKAEGKTGEAVAQWLRALELDPRLEGPRESLRRAQVEP